MNKWKNRFYGCMFALVMVSVVSITTLVMCEQSEKENRITITQIKNSRDAWKSRAEKLEGITLHLEQRTGDLEGDY